MVLLQGPTGWRFLLGEASGRGSPVRAFRTTRGAHSRRLQGYLAHKKQRLPRTIP